MMSTIVLATGLVLILIGLWGMLTHRNILRIIIAFSLIGTGTHIVIVAIGYVANGTAPIIDRALTLSEAPARAVDPIPSALVVTAIVIGLAVTAVMLAYAIRLYESKKTLSIDAFHGVRNGRAVFFTRCNIFIVGLGGGFLIPLLYRLGKNWVATAFVRLARRDDADLGRLPAQSSLGRATDRHPDWRFDASVLRSICEWVCRRPFSPSASISSRCSALVISCAKSTERCCSTCCWSWASRAW